MLDPIFVTRLIKEQDAESDSIIRNSWEDDGYIAFAAAEIGTLCLDVPIAMNNSCLKAGDSCKPGDKKCEEAFIKYVAALKKGYKKSFDQFLKESKLLGYVSTGLSSAAAYFGNKDASPEILPTDEKRKQSNLVTAVAIIVPITIAIGIFYLVKHNKKK